MIKKSFIFLEGIRERTEQKLWSQGINNWNDFIKSNDIKGVGSKRRIFYDQKIRAASEALRNEQSSFFTGMKDSWRLYDYFKDKVVFLDIEISNRYGDITIMGLFDGIDTKVMVKGINLDKELLKKELSNYKLIISFNGSSFDLPKIDKYFDDIIPEVPHIDLRHVCAKVGLTGGLKEIEKELGLDRPHIIDTMYGGDPTLLWKRWLATGDCDYINLLVRYNEEDIINLKPIAEHAIKKLWKKIRYQQNESPQPQVL